jgi:hypothetical protein
VAYPVQAFRLGIAHLYQVASLSETGGDSCGERPDLFRQFNNCEADDLEYMHKIFRRQMTVRVLRV